MKKTIAAFGLLAGVLVAIIAWAQVGPLPMMMSPQAVSAPTVIISSINLSNGTGFTIPANAGSTIDTISATCSLGSCAGATFALATQSGCTSTNNGAFATSGTNLNIGGTTINDTTTRNICLKASVSGATDKYQSFALTGVGGGGGGSGNVLLGSYQMQNYTPGTCTVLTRCPDYNIQGTFFGPGGGSNPCNQTTVGLQPVPMIVDFAPTDEGGSFTDMNSAGSGAYNSQYANSVATNLAPCASKIYAIRIASEWYNCNQNSYSVFTNPGCEGGPYPFPPSTFINAVNNIITAIRNNPTTANLKIEIDAPKDAFQQQYWDSSFDSRVQMTGVDYYFIMGSYGLSTDPTTAWNQAKGSPTTEGTLEYIYAFAQAHGKAMAFPESCVAFPDQGQDDASGPTFMNLMWPWATTHLVALTYWDSQDSVGSATCPLGLGTPKTAAFAAQLNHSTYTGSYFQPYKTYDTGIYQ